MEDLREVCAETEGVERAGDGVREPVHPSREEAARVGQRRLDPQVATAGSMDRAAQLRVGGRGQQSDEAVQEEDDDQCGARNTRGDPRENEDASPDHRPDADHRHVEKPHFSAESDFTRHSDSSRKTPAHPRNEPDTPRWKQRQAITSRGHISAARASARRRPWSLVSSISRAIRQSVVRRARVAVEANVPVALDVCQRSAAKMLRLISMTVLASVVEIYSCRSSFR